MISTCLKEQYCTSTEGQTVFISLITDFRFLKVCYSSSSYKFHRLLDYKLPTLTYLGSTSSRAGSSWRHIGGRLSQIDSGPFGIVWGVNKYHHIYVRTGITWRFRAGRGWRRIPGGLKQVSAGEYGVWGVNKYNHIYFRRGVTRKNPGGKPFLELLA